MHSKRSKRFTRVNLFSVSYSSRALDKLHLGGKRKGMPSRSNAKHQTRRVGAQSPDNAKRNKAVRRACEPRYRIAKRGLETGIYVRSSTCRCIPSPYDVEDPFFPADFSRSHLRNAESSQPATGNREKSRSVYRITLKKIKPEKLDHSRILWPRLSPRLAFLPYSPSRGRYCNHLKLPFPRCSHIEL